MKDRIKEYTINRLVEIGRQLQSGADCIDVAMLKRADEINRLHRRFWAPDTSRLSNDELAALIVGMTYAARELKWSGGSGASTIWLFSLYQERDVTREEVDDLACWVLANTRNPYNPFGTQVTMGARNYSEYLELHAGRMARIAEEQEYDKELQRQAQVEREEREKRRQLAHQDRQTNVRKRLIEKLNSLSVSEQLVMIADDDAYPPHFYPTRCADSASQKVIELLPETVKEVLALKLKGKQKGPWGSFKKRLLCDLGPRFERRPWFL